jgi:hypothetical protein
MTNPRLPNPHSVHPADGSDSAGRQLDVLIRIGADGRVFLHDITADLLPVLVALNPLDPALKRRAESAAAFQSKEKP